MNTTCPICGGPMKPLLTGTYCEKDCDRKEAVPEPVERENTLPWTIELNGIKYLFKPGFKIEFK